MPTLSVSLEKYLELLDWTGRQIRSDKTGAIPEHLQLILTRIGLDTHGWCDVVVRFGRMFKRAAGSPEHLAEEATRRGQSWLCAPRTRLAYRLGEGASASVAISLHLSSLLRR